MAPKIKAVDLDLKTTVAKLEEDWQMMTDAFGLIPKEDSRLKQAKPLKQNELALFTQPKQQPVTGDEAAGEDEEGEDLGDVGEEARAEEL